MKSHFVVKGASNRNSKDTLGVNKSMGVSKVEDILSLKFAQIWLMSLLTC